MSRLEVFDIVVLLTAALPFITIIIRQMLRRRIDLLLWASLFFSVLAVLALMVVRPVPDPLGNFNLALAIGFWGLISMAVLALAFIIYLFWCVQKTSESRMRRLLKIGDGQF